MSSARQSLGRLNDALSFIPTVMTTSLGHTIHADSAYWDCESIEGCWYTTNTVDECTGYMDGFHTALRSDATDEMFRFIQSRRDDAELNNPNYCKKLILDAAGEWSTKNPWISAK